MRNWTELPSKHKKMTDPWQRAAAAFTCGSGVVPAGAEYKVWETANFGWLALKVAVGGRKLFKY